MMACMIGGETVCHRRTAIGGGGISSRRAAPGAMPYYQCSMVCLCVYAVVLDAFVSAAKAAEPIEM